jgi:hypothetical protein
MPQLTEAITPEADALRADWVARASALIDQIADWAAAEGWRVDRGTERTEDRQFGKYEGAALVLHVPDVEPRVPDNEVAVTPLAPNAYGGGLIVIEAMPTFSRVRLIERADSWEIIVDANIPLRRPWTRETFVQLVTDMLS